MSLFVLCHAVTASNGSACRMRLARSNIEPARPPASGVRAGHMGGGRVQRGGERASFVRRTVWLDRGDDEPANSQLPSRGSRLTVCHAVTASNGSACRTRLARSNIETQISHWRLVSAPRRLTAFRERLVSLFAPHSVPRVHGGIRDHVPSDEALHRRPAMSRLSYAALRMWSTASGLVWK